jgi:hypothetical protein
MKLALLFLFMTAGLIHAAPFTAFSDGERFVYRVSWGIIGTAGEITIEAHEESSDGGPTLMRITTTTTSRGIVRGFYRYDDVAEVVIERDTGRLLWSAERGSEGKKKTESRTDFDYAESVARHRDTYRPSRNTDLPLKPGDEPLDLISALIQTRYWDLQPGGKRDMLVHFGRELFPVTVHAEKYETVETRLGTFRALVLEPRMDKEPPRGLFKRGGEIKVWIAEGASHLPVKMQLKLKYGTATLTLREHTAPGAETKVIND